MLKIEKFECNMFQENCYIASDETKECVIIDCGALYKEERSAIGSYIKANELTPKRLICTHGHLDHNFGDAEIFKLYGLRPELSAKDEMLISNLKAQSESFLGMEMNEAGVSAGRFFGENETIEFGSHSFTVISTPGHTPGSVMFYCEKENVVFSGDTLFKMSIGRTDFQFGSYKDIVESLKKVCHSLPADCIVLPGHGEQTTIGFEMEHNPYIR